MLQPVNRSNGRSPLDEQRNFNLQLGPRNSIFKRYRVIQTIKNLAMDLENAGCRARYLIRDRDGQLPALMDEILADAGIHTVLTTIRMPRMDSIRERWVQSCRHELLDRCLVWNERHLPHALREYERFYNQHRAHQALDQAAPLRPAPAPITDPGESPT
ncbi:hypothetical protein [Nonomuraea sp. NPDC049709]|uniref:hypothetical protein n=1 Tax=Nonomuraea sp. NPDC049709 TaxID=3154736 RepID=UPI00343DC16E